MKKDKDWFKKNLERVLYNAELSGLFSTGITSSGNIVYDDVLTLIDQLDEPEITDPTLSKKETVEVPQFVADWIEKRKDDFKSSYDAVIYLESCVWYDEAHVEYEVYEWLPENLLTFCKAWELDYTIEQPKLLTVIVKDYDKTIMNKQLPEDEVNKMMEGME